MIIMANKFKLKGHMSFVLRNGWISKGMIEISKCPRLYWEKYPNIILGVGSTMAKSIRFYLSQTGIIEEINEDGNRIARLTDIGNIIYENDRYFEYDLTLALAHYKMINNEIETIWSIFFNDIEIGEFTKEDIVNETIKYINKKYENPKFSIKSVSDDVNMIIKSYQKDYLKYNPEDNSKSIFSELNLVEEVGKQKSKKIFKKVSINRTLLPREIFAYIIYDNAENSKTVTIDNILNDRNNIGKVFNLKRHEVIKILYDLEKNDMVKITTTADLNIVDLVEDRKAIDFINDFYIKRSN